MVYRIFVYHNVGPVSKPYFVLLYACDLSFFDVVLCPCSSQLLATPLCIWRPNENSPGALEVRYLRLPCRVCCLCRSQGYTANTCRPIDGYLHSDGYCYFTPSNCSSTLYHANCRCYRYRSTSYSRETCVNLAGYYFDAGCYNNGTGSCYRYWYDGQCYNRRSSYMSSSRCIQRDGVHSGYYCYYNSF